MEVGVFWGMMTQLGRWGRRGSGWWNEIRGGWRGKRLGMERVGGWREGEG